MSVAVEGFMLENTLSICPTLSDFVTQDMLIDLAGTSGTVTMQSAVRLEPSVDVAVMVAVPTAWALTLPVSSTDAIESAELLHLTFLLVASSGSTFAVNCAVLFTSNSSELLFNVIDLVNTGVTVTIHFADTLSQVTVISAVPIPGVSIFASQSLWL